MKSYLLITGATGGLGSAFVIACAEKGHDLVLTDFHERGADFAKRIAAAYNVEVHYFGCDLTSDTAREQLYQRLQSAGMKFWGLINVAGLDYEGAYALLQRSQVMRVLRVNLLANMELTHEILGIRDPARTFRLINVSSMAGFYPMPFKATYAATKRFLLDFSLALREEIREFGTVTVLCPGGMPTTEACMRAIFAQGFWGWATTVDPHKVARATLARALRGQAVYIPGFANWLLQAFSACLPTGLKVHFVASRWRKAQDEIAARQWSQPSTPETSMALDCRG